MVPAVFLVCAIAFLLARFGKHHFAHAGAGMLAHVVQILVVVLVLGLLMLRSVRYQAEQKQAQTEHYYDRSAQIDAKMHAEAAALAKQQEELGKRIAELTKNIQQRIDRTDIHQLMDEFQAPRIVLDGPFSSMSSPAALLVAAAPTAISSFESSATAEASNSSSQSNDHIQTKSRKKNWGKPANFTLAKNKEQAPAKPAAPSPPAAPAPSAAPPDATPPAAEAPAEVPVKLVAELPSGNDLDLHKAESSPMVESWRFEPNAAKRPAWTKNPPKKTGDVRREVIVTDLYATAEDCYRAADIYLMLKAYDRLQEKQDKPLPYSALDSDLPPISFSGKKILLGGDEVWNGTNWTDGRFQLLSNMGIGPDFLRREIIAKDPKNNETCEYIETAESSVGPMKRLFEQIEFTPSVDHQLMQRHDAFERRHRFAGVGLGAFSVFGLLSIAWGLLKVDTATKGYYTKWLFVGVPIAIIGVTMLSLLALVGIRG